MSEIILAADIGGTHARLAIVSCGNINESVHVETFETFQTADFPSLETLCEFFLNKESLSRPAGGVIAIAGVEGADHIASLALPWCINPEKVRESLRMPGLTFINDFVAAALGTRMLMPDDLTQVSALEGEALMTTDQPTLVIGPGTGFGAAVLFPSGDRYIAISSEAGQSAFAPGPPLEIELLKALRGSREVLTIGEVLSGPGLSRIEQFLRSAHDSSATLRPAPDIIRAALEGDDEIALKSIQRLCEILGGVAGDLALIYKARGGVYLAGGILPRIKPLLLSSFFMQRFVAKGYMRRFLESIPVYLAEHAHLGVLGAAHWWKLQTPRIYIKSYETRLFREAAEAPQAIERQLQHNQLLMEHLGQRLREHPPRAVITCARGSSDHAATYARYLIETQIGVLSASVSPSIYSLYESKRKSPLDFRDVLFLAISQSGASPDLVASAKAAKAAGAWTFAFTNTVSSPLAQIVDVVVPLYAGPESSVAASKSYLCSLSALLNLISRWSRSDELQRGLARLPGQLSTAQQHDWNIAAPVLKNATSLYVVGRGLGLGIAQEAALKFKETCAIHAEAYSAAEVQHGPLALVSPNFPVMVFAQADETLSSVSLLAQALHQRGAKLLLAGVDVPGSIQLPTLAGMHPAIAPLASIQSFYTMINAVALARGYDPDRPRLLQKITETL
jgi:glutamine---fructose-6-phosphate transaminase (isomerizing)